MKKQILTAIFGVVMMLPMASLTVITPAHAQTQNQHDELGKIFNQVAKHTLVRAKFTQQKKLANTDKVFHSSGDITFAKNQGVLWLMARPVKADLIMTQHHVVQKTANTQNKISLAQNQYAGVANVFLQILTGNQESLLKNFTLEKASYRSDQWQLVLSPKNSTLKKLFNKIELSGADFVKQIIIDEKQGGKTTITLSSQSVGTALNANEVALFELAK